MNVDIDTSQVDALAVDLMAAGVKAQVEAGVVVTATARELQVRARADAPVRTGELRASIYLRGSGLEQTVGSDVRQGFYQEFGTSVMPPQPWLYVNAGRAETSLVEGFVKLSGPV